MKKPVKAALLLVVSASFLASCTPSQPEDSSLTDDTSEASSASSSAASSSESKTSETASSSASSTTPSTDGSTEEGTYYTVSFDSNGGSEVASQRVKDGEKAAKPTNPTKDGFTFSGWYKSNAEDALEFDFETVITMDMTLYARWAEGSSSGGGDSGDQTEKVQYWIAYGPDNWTQEKAIQMDKPKTGNDLAVLMGYKITAADFKFKITNFTDAGWYGYNDSLSGVAYAATAGSDITLKEAGTYNFYLNENSQVWVEMVKYTVTFVSNGGSAVETVSVGDGKLLTAPSNPTKEDYTFIGWYTDEALTTAYSFDTPVTGALTLYAKWEPLPTYTVTFNSNGGSEVASQTIVQGKTATKPATDPVYEGHRFIGWYTDEALTNAYVFTTPVTGALTLYAKWADEGEAAVTYTVSFVTNCEATLADATVEEGQTASSPDASSLSKAYHRFDGWYTEDAFTNPYDFANTPVNANITLYAKWVKFKVTFNSNGGSDVADASVDDDGKVATPDAPTKLGYTFVGWYEDDVTFATEFDFDSALTGDKTVYAKWNKIEPKGPDGSSLVGWYLVGSGSFNDWDTNWSNEKGIQLYSNPNGSDWGCILHVTFAQWSKFKITNTARDSDKWYGYELIENTDSANKGKTNFESSDGNIMCTVAGIYDIYLGTDSNNNKQIWINSSTL